MEKEVTVSMSADTVMTGGGEKKTRHNIICIYTLWLRPKTHSSFAEKLQSVLQSAGNDGDGVRKKNKKKFTTRRRGTISVM